MILLSLVAFALPLVFADVEFTSPIAGADVSVGTINVQWKDSGRAPPIADLTQYTLDLMVGGNDVDNMVRQSKQSQPLSLQRRLEDNGDSWKM